MDIVHFGERIFRSKFMIFQCILMISFFFLKSTIVVESHARGTKHIKIFDFRIRIKNLKADSAIHIFDIHMDIVQFDARIFHVNLMVLRCFFDDF